MKTKSDEIVSGLEISLEKRYELIREQITHEDSLINQRLNWLLLSQGFLFAAFTSIVTSTSYSGGKLALIDPLFASRILFGIPITGLLLNFFSYFGLHAAYQSLKHLRENWYDARPANKRGQKLYDSFPQITWKGFAITTASSTPMVISGVWLLLATGVNIVGDQIRFIAVVCGVGIIWMLYSTTKN
jgi:hypothetical protein